MAILAPTLLTSATSVTTGDTTKVTASVTPTAGTVVKASFTSYQSAADNATISGLGLTWTLADVVAQSFNQRVYVWLGTGTASAGAVTFTRGGTSTLGESAWVIEEFPGADTTTPEVQSVTNTASSAAVTATFGAAFLTGSAALSTATNQNGQTATAQSGWTIVANPTIGGLLSLSSAYRLASETTAVGDFTPNNSNSAVIGVELRDAPSGGGGAAGSLVNARTRLRGLTSSRLAGGL